MPYALVCIDKPDALAIRLANRDAHLEHIRASGVVAMAGPLLNEAGGMTGSLIVLDVDDAASAERWASADPYAQAGLFATVGIHRWKKVVG